MNDHQGTPAQSQRELEIAAAENALTEEEQRIMMRASEAVADLSSLAESLAQFRCTIAEARTDQPRNAQVETLANDFAAMRAPEIDAAGHLDRTLVVREDALRARRWVIDALCKDLERVERSAADVRTELKLGQQRLDIHCDKPVQRFAKTRRHAPGRPLVNMGRIARTAPRVRMEADITMTSASNFFTGTSANISHGGVFVATNQEFEPGTMVKLAFRLPSGEAIESDGIVRWVRSAGATEQPAGVGVSFRGLDDQTVGSIQDFIVQRDPIHYVSS